MSQESLFPEPTPPPALGITAHIDGGARGNPGPAAYGVVVRTADGKVLVKLSRYLGIQTNNYAEYSGLLAALEYAQQNNFKKLKVVSDSELLVKQMKGQYQVRHPALKTLFSQASDMARRLEHFSIQHVLRSSNRDADRLVNEALDREDRKRQSSPK